MPGNSRSAWGSLVVNLTAGDSSHSLSRLLNPPTRMHSHLVLGSLRLNQEFWRVLKYVKTHLSLARTESIWHLGLIRHFFLPDCPTQFQPILRQRTASRLCRQYGLVLYHWPTPCLQWWSHQQGVEGGDPPDLLGTKEKRKKIYVSFYYFFKWAIQRILKSNLIISDYECNYQNNLLIPVDK